MAPARKKAKKGVVRYTCTTCDEEKTTHQFPNHCPTRGCEHLIMTCSACLKKWITAQLEDKSYNHIKCPEPGCTHFMEAQDVKRSATKKTFARFDELERRHKADNTPGWRWCLSATCLSGQVHRSEVPKKVKGKEAEVEDDIFVCDDCGAKACVPCDRPWHNGETCKGYKNRTKGHMDEEELALKTIEEKTKECPSCNIRIEKDGGCSQMQCMLCGQEFFWDPEW